MPVKSSGLRRFRFCARDTIIREFNHVLQMDGASLRYGNVLHVIDVGTSFQNGGFKNKLDAVSTWKNLSNFWIDVYAGAPDYIHTDAGTIVCYEQFNSSAEELGKIVPVVSIEAHDRIGKVVMSHAYMRTVYEQLCVDRSMIY